MAFIKCCNNDVYFTVKKNHYYVCDTIYYEGLNKERMKYISIFLLGITVTLYLNF